MFENRYMTVTEMAHYLGIGRTKAYKLAKDPSLPVIHIGQKILIDSNRSTTTPLSKLKKS